MTKTMKEILNKEQNRIDILQDKDLLYNIVKEVNKKVAGNEDMILALIIKICLRLVVNANPTSSNVLISDNSGSGKDWTTQCVCNVLVSKKQYEHVTDISDKLLNYWTISKKDGGTFDGMVLHLEDPGMDRITSQAFKVRASGENAVKFVDRGKAKHIHIEGKPVMIVTSMLATIDEEGARRWDSLRMDKTTSVTRLMKKMYGNAAAGLLNQSANEDLRFALQNTLSRKNVVIPYAPALLEILPDTIIMRTQQQKLLDYIKASAALHQYQRHRTKDGTIIANLDDYDYAKFCFIVLGDAYGVVLSKAEEEVVKILMEHGVMMPVRDICAKCSRGREWMYLHLPQLKEKGILLEESPFDDLANRPVQCYSIHPDYNKETNTSMPSIETLTGCLLHSRCKSDMQTTEVIDRKTYIGEVAFPQFGGCLRRVDEDRVKDGLPPLVTHTQNSGNATQSLYNSNSSNGSNLHVRKQAEMHKTTTTDQTSFDLFQQIQMLRKYVTGNAKSGYKIDMDFLEHKFSQDFIRHCIDNNVIRKRGDEEWEMV